MHSIGLIPDTKHRFNSLTSHSIIITPPIHRYSVATPFNPGACPAFLLCRLLHHLLVSASDIRAPPLTATMLASLISSTLGSSSKFPAHLSAHHHSPTKNGRLHPSLPPSSRSPPFALSSPFSRISLFSSKFCRNRLPHIASAAFLALLTTRLTSIHFSIAAIGHHRRRLQSLIKGSSLLRHPPFHHSQPFLLHPSTRRTPHTFFANFNNASLNVSRSTSTLFMPSPITFIFLSHRLLELLSCAFHIQFTHLHHHSSPPTLLLPFHLCSTPNLPCTSI